MRSSRRPDRGAVDFPMRTKLSPQIRRMHSHHRAHPTHHNGRREREDLDPAPRFAGKAVAWQRLQVLADTSPSYAIVRILLHGGREAPFAWECEAAYAERKIAGPTQRSKMIPKILSRTTVTIARMVRRLDPSAWQWRFAEQSNG